MKKILAVAGLALLLSVNSFAAVVVEEKAVGEKVVVEKLIVVPEEPYNGFAFTLAPSSIASDMGYVVKIGTPHVFENRTSFGLQFGQYLHQVDKEKQTNHYRLDLVLSNRIYTMNSIAINFNSHVFYMCAPEITRANTFGLQYSTSAEVFTSRRVSLMTELGWSVPFLTLNSNESVSSLGRGVTLNLGVKLYI